MFVLLSGLLYVLMHVLMYDASPETKALIHGIVDKSRLVKWVVADANTIKLNLEKAFPEVDAGSPCSLALGDH